MKAKVAEKNCIFKIEMNLLVKTKIRQGFSEMQKNLQR